MKKIIYFILFCLLVACNGKSTKNENMSDGLIVVDWNKEYPFKEISLQEIADVEYIPMETRTDVLFDRGALHQLFMSDSLFVTSNLNEEVFVFNRQGKNIHSFNRAGRAPEQYHSISFMSVDLAAQEIYITNRSRKQRINVYAFDGTFKRALRLPENYELGQFFDYDEEYLVGIDKYDIEHRLMPLTNMRPYGLISKKDGSVRPIDLVLEKRVSNSMYIPKLGGTVSWPVLALLKNGSECLLSDLGSDTIYRLENYKLIPFVVKRPSGLWESTPPKVASVVMKTSRYVFIDFFEQKMLQEGVPENWKKLVYDQQTGEISTYRLINNDYLPGKKERLDQFWGNLLSGYVRGILSPSRLLQDYEAGKLTGKLAEVASRLNEDDNSVLMLVKFKE